MDQKPSTADLDPRVDTTGRGVQEKVEAAVAAWTGQLIDLGGRNTLLYYRDLKQGTLALEDGDPVAVERLLASHTVRLSNLFDADALSVAARRARTIRAKAAENFEERGLQTLFLAWGMATWKNNRGMATPAAPVLLRQAHMSPRGGAEEDFDLSLPGDWEVNPTLLHLLNVDHDIQIDAGALLDLFDADVDPPDAIPTFDRLIKEAMGVEGFTIARRVVLGNFSYAKLPMVQDLETAGEVLAASPIVAAIAGDEAARQVLRDRHPTGLSEDQPDRTPPADEYLVLDADASQSYVINAVVGGGDLVCVGPPGTGKSQTIANLIATLAARGKTVLFVAEKRAAIDAVVDRLAKVGLAELVMDLHDGPGSRRRLAQQLSKALTAASQVPLPDMAAEQERLVHRRDDLKAWVDALHTRREPWGLSFYDVQAELLGLGPSMHSGQRLRGDVLASLTADAFRGASEDLERFIGLGGFTISLSGNPWVAALAAGSITNADQARQTLEAITTLATHTLPGATLTLRRLLGEVGLAEPRTVAEWAATLELIGGVGQTLVAFRPEIFDLDLEALAADVAPAGGRAMSRFGHRLADSSYRRALKALRVVATGSLPHGHELHAAVTAAAAQAEAWASAATDGGRPRLPDDLSGAAGSYGQLSAELRAVETYAQVDLSAYSADDLAGRLQAFIDDQATLFRLPELHRLDQANRRRGLGPLVDEMGQRQLTIDQALGCLRHVWLASILEAVSIADVRVGAFDGGAHTRTAAEFRTADAQHITTAPVRIRRKVAEHITAARDAYPKESQVVANEAAKKQRHLPVRQLFQAAPNVLGAVKPCWAMSPLVVAQLLPAERCFDVVIFDEASQVTPADAVGALMRAGQVVVAGDPHQLPPTRFFEAGGGEDDEEEAIEAGGALIRDLESVLDVMTALLPAPYGTRTLGWHYRSRDERLIAFSNAQPSLYDWALTTFPGASAGDVLGHHLVPFTPGRVGQEESVADEVAKVVELVSAHAHSRPTESLGVIAMGIKHANRITEALRRARQADATLDAFMSESAAEPFFVKNLERVQGDERDAIILTIGYGKNSDGRMLYRFGPLNTEGGERRLNVAITRARSRMTAVSSFSSDDMDPNRLSAEGAKMLARYLAYTESGGSDLGPVIKDRPELNPFERDVRDKLTTAGIPLVAQYGCSGYWIDFAAQHPTEPGRMVLAIEADGASYHSSATSRDRDRLRQQHLENLGWVFHRIWSAEWFHRHEAEVARALDAYHAAVARADRPQVAHTALSDGPGAVLAMPQTIAGSGDVAPPRRSGRPPVEAGRGSIDEYRPWELAELVRWIESDTLLRTEEQLVAEAMQLLGFRRRGAKIVAALNGAIAAARRPGQIPRSSDGQMERAAARTVGYQPQRRRGRPPRRRW